MSAAHEEREIQGRLFDPALSARLFAYSRPYRLALAGAVALLFAMSLLVSYLPVLVQRAIDGYIAAGAEALPAEARMAGIARLAGLYAAVGFAAFLMRYGQGLLMAWLGQRMVFDIRASVYGKIMALPMKVLDKTAVGRLMTRVSSDVEAMQRMISDGLVGLASDLFLIGAILYRMFSMSTSLAAAVLLVMPLLFWMIVLITRRVRRAHREVRRRQSALNAFLQEMITGMITIQLFHQEKKVRKRFDERSSELLDASQESVNAHSWFFPTMEYLGALALSVVLAVGGWMAWHGAGGVTLGVVVAFMLYARDFFRPLEELAEKTNIFQAAMASCERIFALLDTPEEIEDPAQPVALRHFRGEIEFRDVRFAYNPDDWILHGLSFHVRPGESIALVGATGAGKSSVISLISRLYDVQEGAVLVDGHDVRAYRQSELRRRIGVVMQDPFIFSGTIAENIALFDSAMTRAQIEEAARFVNADGFIRALHQGYDTRLEERGSSLSTGQKQLLALARALARDPDIMLILDEATANVDTETEQLIQKALQRIMRDRTTIVVAHRLSTVRHVDRIFVMRQGHIIEEGSHAQLIAQQGHYRDLYELLRGRPAAPRPS